MKALRARFYPEARFVVIEDGRHTLSFSLKELRGAAGHLRAFNLRLANRWRNCGGWHEASLEHIQNLNGKVR